MTANVLPNEPSKPNRSGAPRGNVNRMLHGLRSALTIGGVPKWMPGVRGAVNRFRRGLEDAVCELHGHVGASHAVVINGATRAELRYLYAARAFRDRGKDASLADQQALWATMAAACDARDKAIRRLGLDTDGEAVDPWALPTDAVWMQRGDGLHESSTSDGKQPGGQQIGPSGNSQSPETHQPN